VTSPETSSTVYLRDYTVPEFVVPQIVLDVDLRSEEVALVKATVDLERNPQSDAKDAPLRLNLDELSVESVAVDGAVLSSDQYTVDDQYLTISEVPRKLKLETLSRINPKSNTKLMGLYTSSTGFFTLCEAEGFRRITPFLDRPDVMARYTVTLHADREKYPVLLSNGNLVAEGNESDGRRFATWEDPFPKPSYLFAIVAARLEHRAAHFTTRSGRDILLQFFVEPGKLDQGAFALESLKHAMKWDEDTYGLECDLKQFNLAAVGDFNAGAMENKGLNVFNTSLVLARPDISTDWDFKYVDRTVAHEYFHNWTGNRVTCRDWFELSLKEGLTDFREQQYAADRYSAGVERIQTVRNLWSYQFPEDAGPMAHPVRPQSYEEISNFYTNTVYNKGAEVVGMLHTLLGQSGFRKGMDLYFERHDGQAVTTDDFVQAMQDANDYDLTQFKRWYDQAGTPRLEVHDHYEPSTRTYQLTVRQSCPATPGQPEKLPFHIPFTVGLLKDDGQPVELQLDGESSPRGTQTVLSLRQETEVFRFAEVSGRPVPSLGRNFSAPVIINYDYSDAALMQLLSYDTDCFNRWQAGQSLAMKLLLQGIADLQNGREPQFPDEVIAAFGRALSGASADPAFAAEVLTLPSEVYIGQQMEIIDPDAIHRARRALRLRIATALKDDFRTAYETYEVSGSYSPDAVSAGRRSLRNLSLAYLMDLGDPEIRQLCGAQLAHADNMTDALSALTSLANCDTPERLPALKAFYDKWHNEPLVVDKWLGVQAASRLPATLDTVRQLTSHPAFDLKNPNKVYALIGSFAANQFHFHASDGSGYEFLAAQIASLDRINPQVTARLARNFEHWKRFDSNRKQLMRATLEHLKSLPTLSKESAEVITKALS
jgi:aminopeptidase N